MSKKKRPKNRKSPKAGSMQAGGELQNGLPWGVLILLAIAFSVASYLGWTSVQSGTVAGCGPESGCADVLASRWSSWFGVPVSLLALPFYAFLFIASLGMGNNGSGRRSDGLVGATLAAGLVVSLAALWFTGIQAFVIGKFCPWCLTAHAAGLVASILVMRRIGSSAAQASGVPLLTPKSAGIAAVAGCMGLTLLVGGQLVYQPDTFVVATVKNDPSAEGGEEALEEGVLSLHGGRFKLDASEHPLIGKPDAGNYVLSLFDYTCQHCRATHPKLKSLHASFPDELAIVSLPMPLNGDCNAMMRKRGRRTNEAHEEACHYASASLAVYRLKPEAWAEYDDWLFEGGAPPTLGRAVSRAAEIVGDMAALQQMMQSEEIEEMVKLSVSIYEGNVLAQGKGTMPQVVIGNSIVTGEINDPSRLYALVADEFGLLR